MTPKEAAEMGQYYLHPPLRNISSEQADECIIIVQYCSETNNWVLEFSIINELSMAGFPSILAINRSNGSMVMYNWGAPFDEHNIETNNH